MAGDSELTLHIRLQRDASGYPPFESEELLAERVGNGQFELRSAPAFAHGLAVGDVVSARPLPAMPNALWIDGLVSAGGRSTFRAIGLRGAEPDEPRQIATRHGCVVQSTHVARLVAIDVPPTADVRLLFRDLKAGRVAGTWDFDIGVLSDDHAVLLREDFAAVQDRVE